MSDDIATQVADIAASAPVAQTPQPTNLADARARAMAIATGETPAAVQAGETAPGPNATQAEVDAWDAKLKALQIKPQNIRERLAAKQAREQAAAQTQSLQEQYNQLQSKLQEVTGAEQRAMNEFQAHLDKGDVEAALKVKGLPVSFEDLQRAKLKAMGAISDVPRDPRVDAMEARLKAYEEREAKQQEAYRQRQAEMARQRERQEGIEAVKQELSSLSLPGAKELTTLQGFNEAVLELMMHNPNADLETAAAVARRDYFAWYQQLKSAFEPAGAQAAQPQRPTKQTPAQVVASRARPAASAAPAPLTAMPTGLSLKEKQALAKKRAAER